MSKSEHNLEDLITESIKQYIRQTGCFPTIQIAASKDFKAFGVKVVGKNVVEGDLNG